MEAVLDRQMPGGWRDKRRWLLLILFLLLIIGVCNCPGGGRLFRGSSVVSPNERTIAPPATREPHATRGPATGGSTISGFTKEGSSVGRSGTPMLTAGSRPGPYGVSSRLPKHTDSLRSGGRSTQPSRDIRRRPHRQPAIHPGQPGQDTDSDVVVQNSDKRPPALIGNTAIKDSSQRKPTAQPKDSGQKKLPALPKDSSRKKPPALPKDDNQKEKENGWMVGIGLNQFFPIGGQQSAYGTDGTTGTLSDYIPVPMLRYYINKKVYLQLEAQFNTPQATKKNLVISYPPQDTIAGTPTRIQSSASIQQLFYFNLPLSVHYIVFDNLNIGTGLQYSRLTNAIGSFDSSVTNLGSPDTVNTKSTHSFKGDTLYQKIRTAELRFLFDASYTYKHFIFGIRYNQALSKFINVQIGPGQTTQGRNTSLQLYLRYILWDGRKQRGAKTPSPPK